MLAPRRTPLEAGSAVRSVQGIGPTYCKRAGGRASGTRSFSTMAGICRVAGTRTSAELLRGTTNLLGISKRERHVLAYTFDSRARSVLFQPEVGSPI